MAEPLLTPADVKIISVPGEVGEGYREAAGWAHSAAMDGWGMAHQAL